MDRMIPQRDFLLCKPTSASNLRDQTSGSGNVHVTELSQKCDVLPLGPSLRSVCLVLSSSKVSEVPNLEASEVTLLRVSQCHLGMTDHSAPLV